MDAGGFQTGLRKTAYPLPAESGMADLERSSPKTSRSFRLNRWAGFHPLRIFIGRHEVAGVARTTAARVNRRPVPPRRRAAFGLGTSRVYRLIAFGVTADGAASALGGSTSAVTASVRRFAASAMLRRR
jgi:hypothetical protein